jgi:lactoylglutathione lyase
MKTSLKTLHEQTRPRIVGLSHIGLFVHDIDKALGFYRDFLGFEEQFQLTEPNGALALKFMKINDCQFIELFPERSPTDDRLYQTAFIVEDAEALRLHLKKHGVAVPDSPKLGRIGNYGFSIKDPDGHVLEFVQYMSDGWTLKDTGKHLSSNRMSARLKHIGITVRNLEPALAFYRDVLGCTETWRGSPDGKKLHWVNMKLPDSDDYLELMLYDEELSPERKGILNHMSLEVDDVLASAEFLTEKAAGLYDRPITNKVGINRKRQCNLFDPDLTRAELMEAWTIDGMSPAWFEPAAEKK